MKFKMAMLMMVVAVLVASFIGVGIAERPDDIGAMRLKQQIDGTWNILNKSSIGVYNETVGEVEFCFGGTEIEVKSGAFAAAGMVHIDTNIGSERCFGIHKITLYADEIGFIEWNSCDKNGSFRRIRKSPIHIINLGRDEMLIVGMGGDSLAVSFLTR